MKKTLTILVYLLMLQLVTQAQNNWRKEAEQLTDKYARIEWLADNARKPEYKENSAAMVAEAIRLSGELPADSLKGKANYQVGKYYQRQGDLATAWKYFQQSKMFFIKSRNY